uniref:Thiamine pyrophosphokinase n=1 Tax=Culicoides sonorensis TaxID=179676 RepID=A0A336K7Q5_CULSO
MTKNNLLTEWTPLKYLEKNNQEGYAIVVLNRPIQIQTFGKLWNNAKIRHCVDGGLNRFLEYKETKCTNQILKPPDLISGDFDSTSDKSMEYAKSKNCEIVHTPDQNETDFTKALRVLSPKLEQTQTKSILVICETSGRLDQIMANINTIFKSKSILQISTETLLLSSSSLSILLSPGLHKIHIPSEIVVGKYWCGLIPFSKSIISTKGLKWNLNKTCCEFGGMVSTSNTYEDDTDCVEVQTDNYVLFTMGIATSKD